MQIILNQGDQNAVDISVSYLAFAFCLVICAGMAPEALWVSKSVQIRNVLSNRALCANVPADLQSAFAGDKAVVMERTEESSVCIIHTVVFNYDFLGVLELNCLTGKQMKISSQLDVSIKFNSLSP